ncbi:hypothetical protein [Roseibium sediminicola]|uniref:Uncharacterized protein n=1 Tax=Roseibium sediminicola TaxID=2933272 RepID=A0ABT0GNY3_9HYPH|nr:hypothetical protein [Roseibium sp. CAU 1639]MCK7611132.1 hypothetical protein [Roseibium sp. CAU 1639]
MIVTAIIGGVIAVFVLAKFTNAFKIRMKFGDTEVGAEANNERPTVQKEHGTVSIGGDSDGTNILTHTGDGTATKAGVVEIGGSARTTNVEVK